MFILVELIPLHFSQVFSVLREHDAGSDLSKEAPGTSSSLSDQGHSFSLEDSLTHLLGEKQSSSSPIVKFLSIQMWLNEFWLVGSELIVANVNKFGSADFVYIFWFNKYGIVASS